MFVVQIQRGKRVLDHSDHPTLTRQDNLQAMQIVRNRHLSALKNRLSIIASQHGAFFGHKALGIGLEKG